MTNAFISSGNTEEASSENFGPNCANFLAGMIEGILTSRKMDCKVSAHFDKEEDENEDNYSAENIDPSR